MPIFVQSFGRDKPASLQLSKLRNASHACRCLTICARHKPQTDSEAAGSLEGPSLLYISLQVILPHKPKRYLQTLCRSDADTLASFSGLRLSAAAFSCLLSCTLLLCSAAAVASKIGLDQLVMAPIGTVLFFSVTKLLDGLQTSAVIPTVQVLLDSAAILISRELSVKPSLGHVLGGVCPQGAASL